MKHRILSLALLTASAALSTLAFAGEVKPTHVVELFTSQGCSSCPPANRFVGKLAAEPNTLVLSYGVTYWDYLGWADTFGNPEFTQRQKDYRDAFGASNIYTPQIVLGGSAHSPRYSTKDVETMPLQGDGVGLSVERQGAFLIITADAPAGSILDIVSYTPGEQEVEVARGENGGKTLRLTNVVTNVSTLEWNGRSARIELPESSGTAYAALVHEKTTARILDASIAK